jgi:hypothetical protein
MPMLLEHGYQNFVKSKLKARNDFLLRYTELYPALIEKEDKEFLSNNFLKDATQAQLEATENRLLKIETHIEEQLKLQKESMNA